MFNLTKPTYTIPQAAELFNFAAEDLEMVVESGGIPFKVIGATKYIAAAAIWDFYVENFGEPLDNSVCNELQSTPTLCGEEDDDAMAKAYITPQKDGRFIVQIKIGYKPNGKPDRKSKSFRSEVEALAQQAAWNKEYAHLVPTRSVPVSVSVESAPDPTPSPVSKGLSTANMSFEDYAILFFQNDKSNPKKTDTSIKGDITTCELIGRRLAEIGFANIKVSEMTFDIAMSVLENIRDSKLSQSALSKARNVLKKVIKEAYKHDYIIGKAFSDDIPFFEVLEEAEEVNPYTEDEIKMLLSCAKKRNIVIYAALEVLNCTGMRPEELRALEWKNLDWSTQKIRITNAINKRFKDIKTNKKGKEYEEKGKTKSTKGKRTLYLSDRVISVLQELRKEADKHPKGKDSPYIFFNNETGDFMTIYQLRYQWDKLLEKNNLKNKGFRAYRFRHTYCTRLIAADIKLPKIQSLMGDSTLDVILKTYNHIKSEKVSDEVKDVVNTF